MKKIYDENRTTCHYVAECQSCDKNSDELNGLACEFCGIPFENDEIMICGYTDKKNDDETVHYHEKCLKKPALQSGGKGKVEK